MRTNLTCGTMLLLLIAAAQSQGYDAVFAFSWFGGYCQLDGHCDPQVLSRWDHQSFSIHGLWPALRAKLAYGSFDINIIKSDVALFDDLNNFMPPQTGSTGSPTQSWSFEWNHHGQAYSQILLKTSPEKYSADVVHRNKNLQLTFFKDLVSFYKRFSKVQKVPKPTITKAELADLLGVAVNQFTIRCINKDSSANTIFQLKMCLSITSRGLTPDSCDQIHNQGCKNEISQFVLPDWKVSSQNRVFAQPTKSFAHMAKKHTNNKRPDRNANQNALKVIKPKAPKPPKEPKAPKPQKPKALTQQPVEAIKP